MRPTPSNSIPYTTLFRSPLEPGDTNFLFAQRFAMRLGAVVLVRGAVADMTADNDERRPIVRIQKSLVGVSQPRSLASWTDRKSTRLKFRYTVISYYGFC